MKKPNDYAVREQAIDISRSFIVQAPAGSGKTELLIQRYLHLLADAVKNPEEILAITFTKKAAQEMKSRITESLNDAMQPIEDESRLSPHKKTTRDLAKKVLKKDTEKQWHLLSNPNRMRIQTIDSFCMGLVQQMPILSQLGASPVLSEQPEILYRNAVRDLLLQTTASSPWSSALQEVLLYLDNDIESFESLFAKMLETRDQWINYIFDQSAQSLEGLGQSLTLIIQEHFDYLHTTLSHELREPFKRLMNFCSQNLHKNLNFDDITFSLEHWKLAASILLTSENEKRTSFTKREGFLAPASAKDKTEKIYFTEMKQAMTTFINAFSADDEFLYFLAKIKKIPSMTYSEEEQEMVVALSTLLKILLGFLHLQFQHHGAIDYIEIAQRAIQTLGDEHNPSDAALKLDYKIRHILIDEFQDTSIPQETLLKKLITGWEPQDGRTLFLVGDPMQSIYRFRKAEVGIFLRAQEQGIGNVPLEKLHLTTNFRSSKHLVEWHNQIYSSCFPEHADIGLGAVPFSAADSFDESDTPSVSTHAYDANQSQHEIEKIITLVKAGLAEKKTIAILTRSRNHLSSLMQDFAHQAIPYRAVEMQSLSEKLYVRDLLSLTKALLHPEDNIAWAALLRAPWLALSLSDLSLLCNKSRSVSENLFSNLPESLSTEGKARLHTFIPIIKIALEEKGRCPLTQWIYQTWLALAGPATLENAEEMENVRAFLQLIRAFENAGNIEDFTLFESQLNNTKIDQASEHENAVELMTIHKSKGLEFDIVIIPSLHRISAYDQRPLLLWMERTGTLGNEVLFAPIPSNSSESPSFYDYIRDHENKKAMHESKRLLYVATTRAKKHLHLFAGINKENTPKKSSFLAFLPRHLFAFDEIIAPKEKSETLDTSPILQIDRLKPTLPRFQSNLSEKNEWSAVSMEWSQNPITTQMGSLLHELLRQWGEGHKPSLHPNRIKQCLYQFKIPFSFFDEAYARIERLINICSEHEKAQWILSPHHLEAKNEIKIDMTGKNPQQIIIDRTFVDAENIRWIIDYKTSEPLHLDNDTFLRNELATYKEQLEHYAHVFSQMDTRPIRTGLYFPLVGLWCPYSK